MNDTTAVEPVVAVSVSLSSAAATVLLLFLSVLCMAFACLAAYLLSKDRHS